MDTMNYDRLSAFRRGNRAGPGRIAPRPGGRFARARGAPR